MEIYIVIFFILILFILILNKTEYKENFSISGQDYADCNEITRDMRTGRNVPCNSRLLGRDNKSCDNFYYIK